MQHLCTLKNDSEKNSCVRLCNPCYALVSKSKSNKKFIYIAMGLPLLLPDIVRLKVLSTSWKDSVDTLIGIYRGAQYLIGHRDYTKVEKTFFRVHARELFGHNQWRRHLHVLSPNLQCSPLASSCQKLMCRAGCSSHLTCEDIIFFFALRHRFDIQKLIVRFWKKLSVERHLQMYFYWIMFTDGCESYWDALYLLCMRSLTLATVIYIASSNKLILEHVSPKWRTSILKSYRSVYLFKRVAMLGRDHAPLESIKQVLAQFAEPFSLPWDTDWQCMKILFDKTKIFSSVTRPIRIVIVAIHSKSKERVEKHLLIKYDDVINDQVAMTIAYFMNEYYNMSVLRYPVLRIDDQFGMLEMISDSKQLHEIKYVLKSSLINYVLEHNIQETVQNVRQRVINSVASASLFAYTMGLGDRHLRNMMIASNGSFFHIDFGYCFGSGPRGSPNAITLTQGILEALGGVDSISYALFTKQCKDNYIAARRSADFFRRLATLALGQLEETVIRTHFTERFLPGEFDKRAVTHLELALDSATQWSLTSSVLEIGYAVKCSAQEIFAFEF